ncbi:unnamed protein product [Rotaria socialis]|uniref:CCHC-type domain-containing protein n=1 Tax=Rotaria socialis TaxID=392032 RepID=A0A817ZMA8_9BILA|nr:unnamed protein product [Rotaria socialis]CAF4222150.1 unnamed protein product [Rotaria socialis]
MAEVTNNGLNNDHLSGNEYEILEQGSMPNVQVERISRGRRKHPRRGIDNNAQKNSYNVEQETNLQSQQPSSPRSSNQRQNQEINQAAINRKRISFNQLKHAVSSNLPCFFIEFKSDADRNSLPTALHASDLILKELRSKEVLINRFTLVGWSGKKLKLGVNNKEDYAILVGSDKWPTKINGIDIVVEKPKYILDSFALVVRYVPRELDENFVSSEIQRIIASAGRIQRIHYPYQRRTDDYRFDVKDYSEYNAVLQLGRIAIGHSWLSITKFYPGNRLTYCTNCWRIGHLRNKCNIESKYRICLEHLSVDSPRMCKNEPNCAQCDGNHHSLDSQCQVLKEYKYQLQEDVEDAIQKGLLQRFHPQEKSPTFELSDQDFPPLAANDNHSNTKWNVAQPRTTAESNLLRSSDTDKTIESINDNLTKIIDSNKRLENKVDLLSSSMKIVTLDTQLHQAILANTINIMKDFIQYFMSASLTTGKIERLSLVPVAHGYYNRLHVTSSRLINGFQLNQQVQQIPKLHNRSSIQSGQQSVSVYKSTQNAKDEAMHRLKTWNFPTKDQKLVLSLLDEWYIGRTLNTVLEEWEKVGIASLRNQKEYIKILCYNVEGWGTRAVEAIDLVYKVHASICIFTEVGELWNTCRLPHFNMFYQKGTNKNGGVCIAVGKHLKATRIEVNIPNTVIIGVTGLSEPVRIIGIYWSTSEQRDLDDIQQYVIEGTILSGDFNATVKELNSPITDRRGAHMREWINENNLNYITSTTNTSKRSLLIIGRFCYHARTFFSIQTVFFPHTNWKVFEAVLALLQIFWMEEQKKNSADEWYKQYIRFIAAVKNRVTHWKERDNYKPSLPTYIIEKLKEIRKVRNRYYHLRHKGVFSEETRVLLRTMTRESKVDIANHKNAQWQIFLSNIQTSYEKSDKAL